MKKQTSSIIDNSDALSSLSNKITSQESNYVFFRNLSLHGNFEIPNFEFSTNLNSLGTESYFNIGSESFKYDLTELNNSGTWFNHSTPTNFNDKSILELINSKYLDSIYNSQYINHNDADFSNYVKTLLAVSQDDIFSIGEISKTELIYNEMAEKFSSKALFRFLSRFISNNYGNTQLLISIANYISTYSYEDAKDNGVDTLLMSLIPHKDPNVAEFVLRIFDNWHNKDSLKLLDNVRMNTDWLELYLNKIKKSILRV